TPPAAALPAVPGNPVAPAPVQPAAPAQPPAAAPGQGVPAPTTAAPQPPAATPAPPKPTYTAVAGPSCSNSTTGFLGKDADYTLGTAGWLKSSTGGYSGDGCQAGYVSEPMSGNATSYDTSQGALWHFDFGASFKAASCRLSVYVPNSTDLTHVGGNPTHYYLFGQDYEYGMALTPLGQFDVSQVSNRGKWVDQGPFSVTTGQVTLKMVNTGIDYTSATSHAHHAASAVRLSCTAA
ncbi:hypothetical protein, partial [Kitasatospora nipponensis]|uniref:hypothetical protein n=1 Tax=Kitasatospora nipponensis TaxID=258049 RepID=UPI0031D37F35